MNLKASSPPSLANFDSATGMLRALAAYLRGRFPLARHVPAMDWPQPSTCESSRQSPPLGEHLITESGKRGRHRASEWRGPWIVERERGRA
jgi:hypothetical protein